MMKYLKEGIKRGNAQCMTNLGVYYASQSGNHEEAKRHLMTAARSGHDNAMHNLMVNYRSPGSVVSKDDLATTLRAHKAISDYKRTSEPRKYARRHKVFEEKRKDRSVVAEHGRRTLSVRINCVISTIAIHWCVEDTHFFSRRDFL